MELLAEPLYILSQNLLLLKLRLILETAATLSRCITTYMLIVKLPDMVITVGIIYMMLMHYSMYAYVLAEGQETKITSSLLSTCRRKQLFLPCHKLHMELVFSLVTGAIFFFSMYIKFRSFSLLGIHLLSHMSMLCISFNF